MFVNRELETSKNKFRKPNILRKVSKSPSRNRTERCSESPSVRNLVVPYVQENPNIDLQLKMKCNIPVIPSTDSTQCVGLKNSNYVIKTENSNSLANHNTGKSESELSNNKQITEDDQQTENPSTNDIIVCAVKPVQNITLEYITSSPMSFKCDVANCNKKFRSVEKYKKHKSEHNVDGSMKVVKQTVSECPVKKTDASGVVVKCARTFQLKEDLMKHLNDDHKPEDAAFVCWKCGRHFFWVLGLRAHGRVHSARAALTCAWPGCGRAFRQPCRLREHARAHNGDKPYPCRYPNCGWSFRSASKLLRHARRHTNERSHACGSCGRAFLRREHLREHAACHRRTRLACQRPGCQRTFTNVGSLNAHMKKVHREELAVGTDDLPVAPKKSQEKFIVSIEAPASQLEPALETAPFADSGDEVDIAGVTAAEVSLDADVEWHAARTHCTWPLRQKTVAVFDAATEDEYILEEDVQVEFSEGTESDIYTIRSDLFLHGNVLNNEDSEQMAAAAQGAGLGDTGLLDAHPTVDLMQEELMYTDDAAVDESSFRVFLLSGDDIQIV